MKLIEIDACLCFSYMKKLDRNSPNFKNNLLDFLVMLISLSSCKKKLFFKAISFVHNIAFLQKDNFLISQVWKFFCKYHLSFFKIEKECFSIHAMKAKILFSMFLIQKKAFFLKMSVFFYKKADLLLVPHFPYTLTFRNYYFYRGKTFLESYKFFKVSKDIFEAAESLKKAYFYGGKNNPEICCLYSEVLIKLSDFLGDIQLLDLAIRHASHAIFLTTRVKSYAQKEYEVFWVVYALALRKKYDLTHTFYNFDQLLKALGQAVQLFPKARYFSVAFSEVIIFYGSVFKSAYWIELGLSKIFSLVNKTASFFLFPSLLIRGISNLGVLKDNLSLIRDGRKKITAKLTYKQDDIALLNASGENYYCLGVYFQEKQFFVKAIEEFTKALVTKSKNGYILFNLAKTYFEKGYLFNDMEALSIAKSLFFKLSLLYPNSALYFCYLSKILFYLSKKEKDKKKSLCLLRLSLDKINESLIIEENKDSLFLKSKILFSLELILKNASYITQSIQILRKLYIGNQKDSDLLKVLIESLFYLYDMNNSRSYLLELVDLTSNLINLDFENDKAYLFQGKTFLLLSNFYKEDEINGDSLRKSAKISLNKAILLGNKESYYWLACLYAAENSVENTIFYLKQSLVNGFSLSKELLKNNIYFNYMKDNKEFNDFLFNFLEKRF